MKISGFPYRGGRSSLRRAEVGHRHRQKARTQHPRNPLRKPHHPHPSLRPLTNPAAQLLKKSSPFTPPPKCQAHSAFGSAIGKTIAQISAFR
jgi:hypothetical protein